MISFNLFSDGERQYVNKIAEGMGNVRLGRGSMLKLLAFARDIADVSDGGIAALVDGVCSKLAGITDEEWEHLKELLPFPASAAAEDNADEVPDGEGVGG